MIKIRRSLPSDEAFILKCWIKGYGKSPYALDMDKEEYFARFTPHAQALLKYAEVVVAVSAEDEDQILSFAVYERTPTSLIVHYIYTKQIFRRIGIARQLLATLQENVDMGKKFCTAYSKSLKHYPFKYNPIFLIKEDKRYDSSQGS